MSKELVDRMRGRNPSRKTPSLSDKQIDAHVVALEKAEPALARAETKNSGIKQTAMFDVLKAAVDFVPKKPGGFPKD